MSDIPTYIHDQVDRLLALLVTKLKKPRIESLLRMYGQELQELEDSAYAMIVERYLDVAVGAQLDQYGVLVGEDRDGLTDDEYRSFIEARILSNLSRGEINRMTQILSIIGRAVGAVRYFPLYPAGMWFDFETEATLSDTALTKIVEQMTEVAPAGVEVQAIVQGPTGMFRFDTEGLGLDQGKFGRTL